MTAKEKAQQLYKKIDNEVRKGGFDGWYDNRISKECALIAIEEMISIYSNLFMTEGSLLHQYLLDMKKEIISYDTI